MKAANIVHVTRNLSVVCGWLIDAKKNCLRENKKKYYITFTIACQYWHQNKLRLAGAFLIK